MSSWHSYPSIFTLGHRAIKDIFLDSVIVEEKVDGSQISFGKFDGVLRIKSKGKELDINHPEKLFSIAVDIIKTLDLQDGWTYRGEYLKSPKHNALFYDRVPKNHIIIFDINIDEENYLPYLEKVREADRIGLEVVPLLKSSKLKDVSEVLSLLDTVSILGGQKIEGMVFKNYSRFGSDKKVLMGKYVSESFKEVHNKIWGESNPKQGDIVLKIIDKYKNVNRWNKAVQHISEKGELDNTPKDIGKLIIEVKNDIEKECMEDIKDMLYFWAKDSVMRGCVKGIPEWYKQKLLESQF